MDQGDPAKNSEMCGGERKMRVDLRLRVNNIPITRNLTGTEQRPVLVAENRGLHATNDSYPQRLTTSY